MDFPEPHIYPCGEHAITVSWGDVIDVTINKKILSLGHHIRSNPPEGLRDVVPAYHSLTLVYDTARLKKNNPLLSVYEQMKVYLERAIAQAAPWVDAGHVLDVPVCYDESLAPDLRSVAAAAHLSIEEVINLHTSVHYHVYMIGFLPGFAYMGSVHTQLRMPRKATPRTHVPAGSVGIAGEQTGIYPFDSPGGWQLIGQTPVKLFDAYAATPCYFKAGDTVRFHAITLEEFNKRKSA